jgi:hypothetical protein
MIGNPIGGKTLTFYSVGLPYKDPIRIQYKNQPALNDVQLLQ